MANVKRNHSRRAVAVVEMAIVAPLLLLLCFALIEYGWMFVKAEALNEAARNAVRVAILPSATNAQVQSAASAVLTQAGITGYTLTTNPTDVSTAATGTSVTVSLTVPYSNIALVNLPFVPVPQSLSASVIMAKEGT